MMFGINKDKDMSEQGAQLLNPVNITLGNINSSAYSLNFKGSQLSMRDGTGQEIPLERMLNPAVLFQDFRSRQSKKNPTARPVMREISDQGLLMTLQQAARDGRIDIVRKHIDLLGKERKKLNKKDQENSTALHYAVRYNHLAIVKLLIENGADANVPGEYGATPLHYAARYRTKHLKTPNPTPFHTPMSSPFLAGKRKDQGLKMFRSFVAHNAFKDRRRFPGGVGDKNEKKGVRWKRRGTDVGLRLGKSKFPDSPSKSAKTVPNALQCVVSQSLSSDTLNLPLRRVSDPCLDQNRLVSSDKDLYNLTDKAKRDDPLSSDSHQLDLPRRDKLKWDILCDDDFSNEREPLLDVPTTENEAESDYEFSGNDSHGIIPVIVKEKATPDAGNSEDEQECHEDSPHPNNYMVMFDNNGALLVDKSLRLPRSSLDNASPDYQCCSGQDEGTDTELKPQATPVSISLPNISQYQQPQQDSDKEKEGGDESGIPDDKPEKSEGCDPNVEQRETVNSNFLLGIAQSSPTGMINVESGDVRPKSVVESDRIIRFAADHMNSDVSEGRSLDTLIVRKHQNLYRRKEESILLYLIEKNADVNSRDFYGATPLHYAALRGNIVAVNELLTQKNIDIEAKDRTQMTALHCAASNGSLDIVRLLIDHNADIRCLDEEDMTPLHFAAMEGHLEVVQTLFRKGEESGGWLTLAKMIMDQDRDEQTALHLAVENGHIDIVKACLDKGANVNFVKANLITPLHLAATAGQLEIVQVLMEHDADVEAKNALQETPLHRAAMFNRVPILEYLLDKGAQIDCRDKDKETPLMMAVRKNNTDTVRLLLSRGADVSVKDANDKTCLYVAAEEDCVETMRILLSHPKIKMLLEEFDEHENTPLHVASMKGYIKIVRMLLSHKACIDAKNDQNLTPLHLAAKFGRSRIVDILLKQDTSIVNDEDDSSNTPLHLAALEGHSKVVQILLECGAAVDARNANLWTPLDCAASRGWTQTAEALLDGDSPIDPMDRAKTTPLHLASKEGHVDMVKLLLARKADITSKDHAGRNCLDLAIENNQKEAAMAILSHENWRKAMRSTIVEGNKVTTPMRKLIKKLPEVALMVFNQCIQSNGLPPEHPAYEISCNYEFLEDSFSLLGPSLQAMRPKSHGTASNASSKKGTMTRTKNNNLLPQIRMPLPSYAKRQLEMKENHPLIIMVKTERTKLLSHPLISCLLRYKWRAYGRYVYYTKLFLYVIFLMFLTGYSITTARNHHAWVCHKNALNTTSCECISNTGPLSINTRMFVDFGKYMVALLAIGSLSVEIWQMLSQFHNYARLHNLIEFSAYITSLVYIIDAFEFKGNRIEIIKNGRCSHWHRSIAALTVWLSWISLVLFMRKFPKLGIYVVMFTDIVKTFAQFFVVFVLFIIAFGLGFHILLHEQRPIAFLTPARAILKTSMGMLGEFEYDTVFNDNHPVPIAWGIYVLYLIINCIILMNLLVGLAVDDIKGVQENAVLKRLAMQVDLALDVEKALPLTLRRKLVKMEETMQPNAVKGWNFWSFWTVKGNVMKAPGILAQPTPIERLQKQQDELKESVKTLRRKVKALHTQNSRMEVMLAALLKHHKVTVEYEVDNEEANR